MRSLCTATLRNSPTGSSRALEVFAGSPTAFLVKCSLGPGDGSPSLVSAVDQPTVKATAQSKNAWAKRVRREGRSKPGVTHTSSSPAESVLPQTAPLTSGTVTDTVPGLSQAQIIISEWLHEANDQGERSNCRCCDGLLAKIQHQLTSLRSNASVSRIGGGDAGNATPTSSPLALDRPASGSFQEASSDDLLHSSETRRNDLEGSAPEPEAEVLHVRMTSRHEVGRTTVDFRQRKAVLRQAEELLQKLLKKECCSTSLPDNTWHDLIEQSVKARRFRQAVHWVRIGHRQGLRLKRRTFERLLLGACRGKAPQPAQVLWDVWSARKAVEGRLSPLPKAACCALIRALGRQGEPGRAELVFFELRNENGWHPDPQPAGTSCTSGVSQELLSREPVQSAEPGQEAAIRLRGGGGTSEYRSGDLQQWGVGREAGDNPAAMAFNSIMEAFSRAGDTAQVERFFREMVLVWGIPPNKFTFSALVRAHCEAGSIKEAGLVLDSMSSYGIEPDGHLYSLLSTWYARRGRVDNVKELMHQMAARGVPVDRVVQCSLMQAYSKQGRVAATKGVFTRVVDSGAPVDAPLLCTLVHALGKQGQLSEAWEVLSRYRADSSVATVPVWTAVIGASLRHGDIEGALAALEALEGGAGQAGIQTFNTILSGLLRSQGRMAAADFLHRTESVWSPWFMPNLATYSILIGMAAEAGDMEGVCLLLEDMHRAGLRPNKVLLRSLQKRLAASGSVQLANAVAAFRERELGPGSTHSAAG